MYWGIQNRVVVGILVDYEYVLFKVWLFNSMINKIQFNCYIFIKKEFNLVQKF